MAALSPDLIQHQVGNETTWGTPVTQTAKLMMVDTLELEPIVEADLHEEARGSLFPAFNADIKKIEAKGKVSGKQTFEDLHFLEGLFGIATPGGGSPYTRAYVAPGSSAPTPRMQTIVTGNGSNVYTGEGMLPIDAEWTFATNAPVRYTYNLLGEKVSTAGSLAALSDRSVSALMGDMVSLYIDALGGTIGSTQITLPFFSANLKIKSKRGMYPGMGSLYNGGYVDGKFGGTLAMTLMFDTASKAYLDAILGASIFQKLVRIKVQKDSNRILTFDFAGTALKAPKPFEAENNVTVLKFELEATYDSGAFANWFKVNSTNLVSALP